jgi:hypothetical protein
MQEHLLETIRGLLQYNWPKIDGVPVVQDDPITTFGIGEIDHAAGIEPPTITVKSGQVGGKDETFGSKVDEHTVEIEFTAQGTTRELSERYVNEAARIAREIMLPHKRFWVLTVCPLCRKRMLSPEHYLIEHSEILQPYVDEAVEEFVELWNYFHPSNEIDAEDAVEMLPRSGLATESVYKLFDVVRSAESNEIDGLSNAQFQNIKYMISRFHRPIKLMYDTNLSTVKPSDGGQGKELFYTGTISLTCKEQVRFPSYGPDGPNVPTVAVEF